MEKLTKKMLFLGLGVIFYLMNIQQVLADSSDEVKLSPRIRSEALNLSIYKINTEEVGPHLRNLILFTSFEEFAKAPEIIGFEEHSIKASFGDTIYADTSLPESYNTFSIIKLGQKYEDAKNCDTKAQGAIIVGEARVIERAKDVVRLEISKSLDMVEQGYRLIPRVAINLPGMIDAKYPAKHISGQVVGIQNGLWSSAKYDSVVLSVGMRDGLEVGHVLDIMVKGDERPFNKAKSAKADCRFERPLRKYGEVVVFKVFETLSVGIVVKSEHLVSVRDVVQAKGVSSDGNHKS